MFVAHPIPQKTQGKIERWHQTMKNLDLLSPYFLPGDLERQISAFVEHYNNHRDHQNHWNLTSTDIYFGGAEQFLKH